MVSNTTIGRPQLAGVAREESGGLSGRPLFERSTVVLARLRTLVGPELPIVGVGGVATGDDAFQKLAAGATLVQLYTAMIYRGPWIAAHVARELSQRLDEEGIASVSDLSGRAAMPGRPARWAEQGGLHGPPRRAFYAPTGPGWPALDRRATAVAPRGPAFRVRRFVKGRPTSPRQAVNPAQPGGGARTR